MEEAAGETPQLQEPELDPYLDKRCRDFLFLLLLAAYSAGMLVVCAVAFSKGNPAALLYPVDSFGNICGWSPGFEEKRALLYVFPSDLSRRICVAACPSSFSLPSAATTGLADIAVCSPAFDVRGQWGACGAVALRVVRYSSGEAAAFVSGTGTAPLDRLRSACPAAVGDALAARFADGSCGLPYPSTNVFGTCVPSVDSDGISGVLPQAARRVYEAMNDPGYRVLRYQADLVGAWPVLLATGLGAPLVLAVLWLLLARAAPAALLWASLASLLASLAAVALLFFHRAGRLGGADPASLASTALRAASQGSEPAALGAQDPAADWSRTAEALGWTTTAVGGALAISTLVFARRVRMAAGLAEEVGAALAAMPRAALYPAAALAAQLLLWAYIGLALLWLLSAGSHSNGGRGYDFDGPTKGAAIYHILGAFWLALFIDGVGECSLAGTFAAYYFTRDKSAVKPPPVGRTIWRTLRLHAGSVALASLALYPLVALRIVMTGIERHTTGATKGPWRLVGRALRRCLAWHETHLRFVSRRAYVMMAIEGRGFWQSARGAHAATAHFGVYVSPIGTTADALVLFAKLGIATASSAVCFGWLVGDGTYDPTAGVRPVASPLLPLLLAWAAAYSVASALVSVYAMATDVLLFCACVDLERNNGIDRPYYATERLQQFLLDTQQNTLRIRASGKVYQVP